MKRRKIAYVTGTRADYGLMLSVLRAIQNSRSLNLKLYFTGIHLMKKFGNTGQMVSRDFPQAKPIDAFFESNKPLAVTQFIASLTQQAADRFSKDRPDVVLTLGDRAEMLAIATVCLYLGIPTAHIHGGDKTATVDEVARHAVTKLSQLHFPATAEAARRIERMGEEKWRIHTVGAPALDFIEQQKLLDRKELCHFLHLDPSSPFILVTQHPVSDKVDQSGFQMRQTIEAVKTFKRSIVVIYPNADPGSQAMLTVIDREKKNPFFRIYPNLEYNVFLALEKEAAVWVGNSSAAMIESSSFGTPVVNVGTREAGRLHGDNVIHTGHSKNEIVRAIQKSLYDPVYLKRLKKIKNPWGDGHAAERIVDVLKTIKLDKRLLDKTITY